MDYVLSFAFHFGATKLFRCISPETNLSSPSALPLNFAVGTLSGLLSACALYPFDFVRQMSVGPGVSSFAYSSIPFTTLYLGVYFSMRDEESIASRIGWAITSTSLGCVAEFPFDKAKHSMMQGNMRSAMLAAGVRVPLGSFLLVAYDQVYTDQMRRARRAYLTQGHEP
jgi:hypothetical protein